MEILSILLYFNKNKEFFFGTWKIFGRIPIDLRILRFLLKSKKRIFSLSIYVKIRSKYYVKPCLRASIKNEKKEREKKRKLNQKNASDVVPADLIWIELSLSLLCKSTKNVIPFNVTILMPLKLILCNRREIIPLLYIHAHTGREIERERNALMWVTPYTGSYVVSRFKKHLLMCNSGISITMHKWSYLNGRGIEIQLAPNNKLHSIDNLLFIFFVFRCQAKFAWVHFWKYNWVISLQFRCLFM